eukprot:10492129-Ditylum_brightwellii.AAC.1
MHKRKRRTRSERQINTAVPQDDKTVENESCNGTNIDMDNSECVVFGNEQVKEDFEVEMNGVDHDVENNLMAN